MADSQKLHAPKPIKNNSNFNSVKIICDFEKIALNELPSKTYTPKLNNEFKMINSQIISFKLLQNFKRKKQMWSNVHTPKNMNTKTNSNLDEFLKEDFIEEFKGMQIEKSEYYSKSEILSILNKNDSTTYESFCQEISFEEDSYFYVDDLKTYALPERTKNPFHKNLNVIESNLNFINDSIEDM